MLPSMTSVRSSAGPRPGVTLIKPSLPNQQEKASETLTESRFCPTASSLLGTQHTTGNRRLIPLRCKRWSCPYCCVRNVHLLRCKAKRGAPNKFITLTTNRVPGETPKECHRRCRPAIAQLVRRARKVFGPFECGCFLEQTKSGFPHWHLLARTGYIPQRWLSDTWRSLTGAFIVDVRAIGRGKDAIYYVTKYVTKTAQVEKSKRLGRVISWTKGYEVQPKPERDTSWTWEVLRHVSWQTIRADLRERFHETLEGAGFTYEPLADGELPNNPPLTHPDQSNAEDGS